MVLQPELQPEKLTNMEKNRFNGTVSMRKHNIKESKYKQYRDYRHPPK